MPIYEFRCLKCGEIFEYLAVGSGESLELKCQNCQHHELERVLSKTSFNVKSRSPEAKASLTEKKCSGGTCQTITIPGPQK
jgi:putative FmdB family regulatory protein